MFDCLLSSPHSRKKKEAIDTDDFRDTPLTLKNEIFNNFL